MKQYRIAAILMLIHGFIELSGCIALLPILLTPEMQMTQYFSFIVPFFNENITMMLVMGGIYGVLRVLGAITLFQNKMWGLVLSVVNCIVTLVVMMFMLPAGVMDGILSGIALVLILSKHFGDKKIVG